MLDNKILKYAKKFMPWILILCLLATLAINFALTSRRQYVASAVFKYTNSGAEEGKTPSGEDLNVEEIKSSVVMSKVIDRLGLQGSYSTDNLISRISITAVPDEDKVLQKESQLEEGKESTYIPSTYIVSFTASNSEGALFARKVLDELLDTYFSYYSEKYINTNHFNNPISEIYDGNYDYPEMVEILDNAINNTLINLYSRATADSTFRSTESGKTFMDLASDFSHIEKTEINNLFAQIYQNQVTKNKNVLIANYTDRIDRNEITVVNKGGSVADVEELINAYVEKMRNSDNTNIQSDYILDDIYNRDLTDNKAIGEQTVTYDEMIYAWRDNTLDADLAVIDTAYCNFVLNTYTTCTGACDGSCAASGKTCSQLSNPNYDKIEKEIDEKIRKATNELSALYETTAITNEEYNEFLGCQNLSVLSSVSVSPNVNVTLYSIIAFIFLIVICCGAAIIAGRLNNIIEKSFYTDSVTKLKNRAYFDKYLTKKDQSILDDGTVIASLRILNQREINDALGRKNGDSVLSLFADELRVVFAKTNALLIYNGGSHFIAVMEQSDMITMEGILQTFVQQLNNRDTLESVDIVYNMGIAETFENRVRSARKLLLEAINNSTVYTSEKIDREVVKF